VISVVRERVVVVGENGVSNEASSSVSVLVEGEIERDQLNFRDLERRERDERGRS